MIAPYSGTLYGGRVSSVTLSHLAPLGASNLVLVCKSCGGIYPCPIHLALRLSDGVQKSWRCPSCFERNNGSLPLPLAEAQGNSWICPDCGGHREVPVWRNKSKLPAIRTATRVTIRQPSIGNRLYGWCFPPCRYCSSIRSAITSIRRTKRKYKANRKPNGRRFWDQDLYVSVGTLLFKYKRKLSEILANIHQVYGHKISVAKFLMYRYRECKRLYRIFQRYKLTHTYNTTLLLLARSVKSVYLMGYIIKPSAFKLGYGDG